MRFSINIPNFGDFADADTVARVASAAEAAGWDALFVWDHVVHDKRYRRSFGDPWMLLTAAALATTRIRLGPMVTPVPRRRPQQLARQVSTLDNQSGGRVIYGAELGGPIEDEVGRLRDPRRSPLPSSGRDPLCPDRGNARVSRSGWAGSGRIALRCDARLDGRVRSRCSCRPSTATPTASTRSVTWSPTSGVIGIATQVSHSSSPGRGEPDQRRRRERPARPAHRRRRHLVGPASAHGGRDQPARAGAPSHRGRSTDLLGSSASGVTRQRGAVHH